MGYEIDYAEGERVGCSSQIVIADRIFYVKLFGSSAFKVFLGRPTGRYSKGNFES